MPSVTRKTKSRYSHNIFLSGYYIKTHAYSASDLPLVHDFKAVMILRSLILSLQHVHVDVVQTTLALEISNRSLREQLIVP